MNENEGNFFSGVYGLVAQIPRGRVVSYGQIARELGMPRGARQVGWAMRRCPEALQWQRVVKDNGEIAGKCRAAFARGLSIMAEKVGKQNGDTDGQDTAGRA